MPKLPTKAAVPPSDDQIKKVLAAIAALTKRVDRLEGTKPAKAADPEPDEEDDEEEAAPAPKKLSGWKPPTKEEREYLATLPDDAHHEPMPTGMAFGKKKGELYIDSNAVPDWTPSEMVEAARLVLKKDLSALHTQPRELRRQLYASLAAIGVDLEKTPKPAERAPSKKAVMPGEIEKGDDGLPLTSPVVGKHEEDVHMDDLRPMPPHVDRDDWVVKGKMLKLHLIAEDFRQTIADAKKWECQGFNCHDCVEKEKGIDSIGECADYYGGEGVEFEFVKGASEFAVPKWRSAIKKLEAR